MRGFNTKSIVPIIESKYQSLSTVEKTIADFFIENRVKMDFSAKAVSQRLFVSEASLSRFAKKCGYRGYREFIYQYEETFVEKKEPVTKNLSGVLGIYQELLNHTYNLVDEAQIARICRYLSEAHRVFVCGKGSSGFAASEMEMRFMRIGVDIDCIQDSHLMKMQTVFLSNRDLVIGITISATTEEVLYMLQEGHKRGAKTIVLTANNLDYLHEFCDEIVLVASMDRLDEGNMISPQYPILTLTDVIYSSFVDKDESMKEILHDNTVQALGNKKVGENYEKL
ncbi:MAG: MurR/RpiR family transcriptional regulator [Lachnospiraceae bacterium]|nr:MurR/RpiR family transcriptional regulator [Lachnospiraceae bacterium]